MHAPLLELVEERLDSRTYRVAARGEIDMATKPQFHEAVTNAAAGAEDRLVVDLTDVRFVDSGGLAVLIEGQREMDRRRGRLIVVCPNVHVRKLLALTRLDGAFRVVPSKDDLPAVA
jgi:anti-sigma B factor antagonist